MRVNALTPRKWSSMPQTSTPKSSNNRVKRKSRWKLKFHNQATPTEYQRYYVANVQLNAKSRTHFPQLSVVRAPSQPTPPPPPPPPPPLPPYARCLRRRVAFATKATSLDTVAECGGEVPSTTTKSSCWPPLRITPSTVRYRDLPYMGEMTLQNTVPRRGRKPKKADICHLIYKNYGTTVVDEPLNLCLRDDQLANGSVKRLAAYGDGDGDGDGDAGCVRDDVSIREFELVGDGDGDGDATSTSALRRERRPVVLAAATVDGASKVSQRKSRLLGRPLGRANRKLTAREKLEKTFEQRGFLIQTQQLQSAQGATYCKFRQLRKFSRYLFRSWKHHLPVDVEDK